MNNLIIRIITLSAVMAAMTGISAAGSWSYGTVFDTDGTTKAPDAQINVYSDSSHSNLIGNGITDSNGEYEID